MEKLKQKFLQTISSIKFWAIITLFGNFYTHQIGQKELIAGIVSILTLREVAKFNYNNSQKNKGKK